MSTFESDKNEPALLGIRQLGAFLGCPWSSLERQLKNPPIGFPKYIKLGRRKYWPRVLLLAWLKGAHAPSLTEAVAFPTQKKRARGRPRKPELPI